MKRQSLIAGYLLLFGTWICFLWNFVDRSKLEGLGLDESYYYTNTLWVMFILSVLYDHHFITSDRLVNFILTSLLFKLAVSIGPWSTSKLVLYIMRKDHIDIWWNFKYDYLDLVTVCCCLFVYLGIARRFLPVQWRTGGLDDTNLKQQPVVIANLVLLAVWVWVLMAHVRLDKIEFEYSAYNLYYSGTLWTMYFAALLYARFFVSNNFLLNVVTTSVLFMLAFVIKHMPTDLLIEYLVKKSKSKTQIGWVYKYRFLDLAFVNIFVLLAFEIIRDILLVKRSDYNPKKYVVKNT